MNKRDSLVRDCFNVVDNGVVYPLKADDVSIKTINDVITYFQEGLEIKKELYALKPSVEREKSLNRLESALHIAILTKDCKKKAIKKYKEQLKKDLIDFEND